MKDTLERHVRIANTHQSRIEMVLPDVLKLLPMTEDKFSSLTKVQFCSIDMMTNRFVKLLNLIETKIFPSIAKQLDRNARQGTIMDQLLKIKELGDLEDAADWKKLRKIRDGLENTYLDSDKMTVRKINECATHCEALLKVWHQTKDSFVGSYQHDKN